MECLVCSSGNPVGAEHKSAGTRDQAVRETWELLVLRHGWVSVWSVGEAEQDGCVDEVTAPHTWVAVRLEMS